MNARHAVILALGATLIALSACNAPPIDRDKRKPRTAFRGLGFTRLITTFNEVNALERAAGDQLAYLETLDGVSDERLEKVGDLHAEAERYSDDIEWALANQQRVPNHRTYMDTLWGKYTRLFPEEKRYVSSYRSGKTRRYKFQRYYKMAYRENYGIEKAEPRWEDLKPVINKFYETDDTP